MVIISEKVRIAALTAELISSYSGLCGMIASFISLSFNASAIVSISCIVGFTSAILLGCTIAASIALATHNYSKLIPTALKAGLCIATLALGISVLSNIGDLATLAIVSTITLVGVIVFTMAEIWLTKYRSSDYDILVEWVKDKGEECTPNGEVEWIKSRRGMDDFICSSTC